MPIPSILHPPLHRVPRKRADRHRHRSRRAEHDIRAELLGLHDGISLNSHRSGHRPRGRGIPVSFSKSLAAS